TVIGKFTKTGKCVVKYNDKTIMDLDMQFLHNGLPKEAQTSKNTKVARNDPKITSNNNYNQDLSIILRRLNITSFEFVSQQYDHVVQAGLVLSPLQGRGRINAEASVFRPVLTSQKAVVMSQALYPNYSDIDTYHMAAASLDSAVRNA